MKKLLPSLVAVKKITSSVPRESFSELELEQVAKLSLEASGLINPMVLRRTSMQSYEVVDGHFEYYAAVKAKELEPMKGEMVP
ncbi:MAG: ParB N-terminal domain-containing protein, partial [Planktothrix sp.]